jgi:hypothetical protein
MDRIHSSYVCRAIVWGVFSSRRLVCVSEQTFMESTCMVVRSRMDAALSDDGNRSLVGLETLRLG